MRRKAPIHALRASNTAEPKHRSSRLNHALVACWLAAVLVLGCVSMWSVKDHEAVALPPLTTRQRQGGSPNAFDGCAWRGPGAVLYLRTPKAASTQLTNAMREFRFSRYDFIEIEEMPEAVGLVGGPARRHATTPLAARAARVHAAAQARATDARSKAVLAGHTFLPSLSSRVAYAVITTVRDPQQRVASGYNFVRSKEALPAGVSRDDPPTVGACAANVTCARINELERQGGMQARYLCGSSAYCAGAGAVPQALAHLNSSVLLAIPAERIEEGYRALAYLRLAASIREASPETRDSTRARFRLPEYFSGLDRAAASVASRHDGLYDSRGARRSPRVGDWTVAHTPAEAAALAALTRSDQRVYDFAAALFDRRMQSCEASHRRQVPAQATSGTRGR